MIDPKLQPDADATDARRCMALDVVLQMVLSSVEPKSLATARAVSRLWRQVASDQQVRKAVFINHWQLLSCHGTPRHLNFFETASLSNFVRQHAVQRTDTLQMLAVRHGTDVPSLKRVNNIMTDHTLYSRAHLFIPVMDRTCLQGQLVSFYFCPLAKRDFAVVRGALHQQQQQQHSSEHGEQLQHTGLGPVSSTMNSSFKLDLLQAKLCQLLGRSLRVDDSTAKYYLEDAGGDVKAAMEAFADDLRWEGTTAGPIRTVPVTRWIKGEAGL